MNTPINLSENQRVEIKAKLPGSLNIKAQQWLACTPPEWIDSAAGSKSRLSIALVCLLDAVNVAREVDYALLQAYVHVAWYRDEHPNAPLESEACAFGKFYADDAALRLYAAAEHVANFIKAFLEIEETSLKHYAEKGISQAATVGKYMFREMSGHEITSLVKRLLDEKNWEKTISYRNKWVHEQPPLIERPGITYKRRTRWRDGPTLNSYMMAIGGDTWDRPELTLDNLLEMILQAALAFEKVLSELVDILFKKLELLGIERDFNSLQVRGKSVFN